MMKNIMTVFQTQFGEDVISASLLSIEKTLTYKHNMKEQNDFIKFLLLIFLVYLLGRIGATGNGVLFLVALTSFFIYFGWVFSD